MGISSDSYRPTSASATIRADSFGRTAIGVGSLAGTDAPESLAGSLFAGGDAGNGAGGVAGAAGFVPGAGVFGAGAAGFVPGAAGFHAGAGFGAGTAGFGAGAACAPDGAV